MHDLGGRHRDLEVDLDRAGEDGGLEVGLEDEPIGPGEDLVGEAVAGSVQTLACPEATGATT